MQTGDAAIMPTAETVWAWLEDVADPEIPVVSVIDLGIVRDVAVDGEAVCITITPTYSGCPATDTIAQDIVTALHAHGLARVSIRRQLSPPWSTDRITVTGRDKLRAYGIAPPLAAGQRRIDCPLCGSGNTECISEFGSTPCKAMYRCKDCLEPFDYFKCI